MPKHSCEDCKSWLIDETGEKLRPREKGEEPTCEGCPKQFRWHPKAMALLRLYWVCCDPMFGGYRHLPRSGGVLEQDALMMGYLEVIRGIMAEFKDKK